MFGVAGSALAAKPSDTEYAYRDNGAKITLTYTCDDYTDRYIEPDPVAIIDPNGNGWVLTLYAHSPEVMASLMQTYGYTLTPAAFAWLSALLLRETCPGQGTPLA